MNKTTRVLLPVLIITAAVVVSISMRGLSKPPEKHKQGGMPANVEYLTAQPEHIEFTISSRGVVSPRRESRVSSKVGGMVTASYPALADGRFVQRGEPLLAIDKTDYQLAVSSAEADLLEVRMDLEDKQARFAEKTLIVQQARARFDASRKALAKARSDLAATTVEVPFNGVIRDRQLEKGQYIQPGTVVATLAGTDSAEIRLPVTQGNIRLIAPALFNQPLINTRITLWARIGNKQHRRTVDKARLEGVLDPVARSYYLNVELPDPYGLDDAALDALPHGTFVHATIAAKPLNNAYRLPLSVIHDKNQVYRLDGTTLKKQAVTIAYQQTDHVIVTDGINKGDKIVTSHLDIMFDGMSVNPVRQ